MSHVRHRHGQPEPATATAAGPRDLPGALLALGFVVLLLASEAALSLPDETVSDATVATFYAQHRTVIVVLQLMGLAAAVLLAAYAARLRHIDPVVGDAELATAVLACAPGLVTLVPALIADAANPSAAETWNALEPRADDLLFVGISVFGAAVALRPRFPVVARALGTLVAVLCVTRLLLEAAGHAGGAFASFGPISFIVLVGALGVLSAMGRLSSYTRDATPSQ
jgi:hypothetical protein